ncbi:6-phosphogluconolactonase [Demequina sp. B12]|uniref:6-phosphogluconolactonase n=1 Tax=Demequina sp. B12 TaxID=2992757 RepID=UPI00237BCDDF|nr:6-phosphogluconolactonase [Demequina sp. B12]MDE0573153.1 6-phosphogluconolactonase [Demequina sp. B12]
MRQVVVYSDPTALSEATAARLLLQIGDALATRGRADIVLTGGTVGIAVLADAAVSGLASAVDWTSVHVWWGDERFVPTGHADRNEGQAQQALLHTLPLPEDNIHRMGSSDDFATAEEAAAAYAATIDAQGTPAWDVLLLGLGPDAHVASLFPGHPVFRDSDSETHAVHNSPKPPPSRVTLGLPSINRAREVWVVAAGEGKADAVADSLRRNGVPGGAVDGTERTLWLLDAPAATKI